MSQFQKSLSLKQFLSKFATEEACQRELERIRWPDGFVCPRCEHSRYRCFPRGGRKMFECSQCGHQTHPGVGTIFTDTKLPLTTWFIAIYLLTQSKTNVSALELTRHLDVCYRTAWRVKHKIMEAMAQQESSRQLQGFIEIDDAYLGGERNGGLRGRGSPGKQAFIMAVSTDQQGRPLFAVADPVAHFNKSEVGLWAKRRLGANVQVFCDGLGGFYAFDDLGIAAERMPSAPGRKSAQHPRMKWVNTILGNIKRAMDGRYHAIRQHKYARRYLSEAAWRFNRRARMPDIMQRLIIASVACTSITECALRDTNPYVTETRR